MTQMSSLAMRLLLLGLRAASVCVLWEATGDPGFILMLDTLLDHTNEFEFSWQQFEFKFKQFEFKFKY